MTTAPVRPGVPVRPGELPPGPRWPSVLQTVLMFRRRHTFIPAMHRRYGDVFTLRVAPGSEPIVLVQRPEHVREVFAGDPHGFHAGQGNAILGPVMGEHSVLLTDEDQHARARRLLMPAFNGAALRSYEGLVTSIAATEAADWRDGETFAVLDRMNRLTLEVILRVVFGVTDETRLARLRPLVNATVDVGPGIILGWAYPVLLRFGPWRRYQRTQVELDALLYAEIAERHRAGDLAERSDVLSRLLRVGGQDSDDEPLSDAELRDQLVTLLLAGHETTATALAWALHELGRHPRLLARAQADADDPHGGEYLEAVLKESMRRHPVIPMVARVLTAPTRVAGHDLPRGTTVAPSILLAHQRAESFARPDAFDPDRFTSGPVPANTWIPFGGGVRRCLGAGFATLEGVTVLREVLSRWSVEVPGGVLERARTRNITSVPRTGAPLTVTSRRTPA